MSNLRNLLLIGGNGNLGRAVVNSFKQTWRIAIIDLQNNNDANHSILIDPSQEITGQIETIKKSARDFAPAYDSVMCLAGGFLVDTIKEKDIFTNYARMMRQNVLPSILAGHLATTLLSPNGLIVLTGAAAVFKNLNSNMISYSLAKSSVHLLNKQLTAKNTLPENATVTTILPETLDTPQNRTAMPTADFSKWLPPSQIAALLKMWAEGSNRPKNGSFAHLKLVEGMVLPEFL
eukprot:TRINITY_DN14447_c0_g1_i1.p1 TRINITY_DN14447_c0_g1~~TRINITY_DN14447_c0_g1_i1.p1  ORF type:complete len:234 (-),score=33.37 TRINITY_DN14447_c0_g1_i1:154-855(-)